MFRTLPGLAAVALAFALLLGPAPHAAADAKSDCQAAVKEKFDKKVPKAKKFKFGNKVKSVSNTKKGREEFDGTAKYVGREGQQKEMGWKCVVKDGKVADVSIRLEQ
jgi:hypothetical protein